MVSVVRWASVSQWAEFGGLSVGAAFWLALTTTAYLPAVPWLLLFATAGLLVVSNARYAADSGARQETALARRLVDVGMLGVLLVVIALGVTGLV